MNTIMTLPNIMHHLHTVLSLFTFRKTKFICIRFTTYYHTKHIKYVQFVTMCSIIFVLRCDKQQFWYKNKLFIVRQAIMKGLHSLCRTDGDVERRREVNLSDVPTDRSLATEMAHSEALGQISIWLFGIGARRGTTRDGACSWRRPCGVDCSANTVRLPSASSSSSSPPNEINFFTATTTSSTTTTTKRKRRRTQLIQQPFLRAPTLTAAPRSTATYNTRCDADDEPLKLHWENYRVLIMSKCARQMAPVLNSCIASCVARSIVSNQFVFVNFKWKSMFSCDFAQFRCKSETKYFYVKPCNFDEVIHKDKRIL